MEIDFDGKLFFFKVANVNRKDVEYYEVWVKKQKKTRRQPQYLVK